MKQNLLKEILLRCAEESMNSFGAPPKKKQEQAKAVKFNYWDGSTWPKGLLYGVWIFFILFILGLVCSPFIQEAFQLPGHYTGPSTGSSSGSGYTNGTLDNGDAFSRNDSTGVTIYENTDGSTEITDGFGTVFKDIDGDGIYDKFSDDGGITWTYGQWTP
jgi:hypothetical protein